MPIAQLDVAHLARALLARLRLAGRLLLQRFREARLGLVASSLAFTTVLSLVPLMTVALALFTAHPVFAKMQDLLQRWLVDSLVPDEIARQVLQYLNQFAGRARRLGWLGFVVLAAAALALVFTIDRTLNQIWRTRRARALGPRVLIYLGVLVFGPLVLAAVVASTSFAIGASRGLLGALPGGVPLVFDALEFAMLALGVAALYRYVPNAHVAWRDALAGGALVSLGLDLARRALSVYLKLMPGYSVIYGTLATLPILMLWVYVTWLIVLAGGVVAASLPELRQRFRT